MIEAAVNEVIIAFQKVISGEGRGTIKRPISVVSPTEEKYKLQCKKVDGSSGKMGLETCT